jgi:hypothetical protein
MENKKKPPDKNLKSFSDFFYEDNNQRKILNLLFKSSKKVYNTVNSIFNIYYKFKENIFSDLKDHKYVIEFLNKIKNENINNNNSDTDTESESESDSETEDKVKTENKKNSKTNKPKEKEKFKTKYKNDIFDMTIIIQKEIFPVYQKLHNETKSIIYNNNNLIYNYIKNNIENLIVDNDSFDILNKRFIDELINNNKILLDGKNDNYIKNQCKNIIFRILKSFYLKNNNFIDEQIKKHIKISDKFTSKFIDNVKSKNSLFKKEDKVSSKKIIGFELASDQNIISIILKKNS